MTAIEPMVPAPEEPLLPATVERASRRNLAPTPLVRVNLLPDEVVAARKGHKTRRIVLVALAVLVVLLAGVSFFVRSGIGEAKSQLAAAAAVNVNLQAKQSDYADVVTAQNDLQAALGRLSDLTASDIAWVGVTQAIRTAAPAGVLLTGIEEAGAEDSGAAGSVGGAPGGTGAADGSGATAPGTVVLTGYATDPSTVATYVDALSRSKLLSDVVATGVVVRDDKGDYSFGITANVTAAALSHRFDTPGGK